MAGPFLNNPILSDSGPRPLNPFVSTDTETAKQKGQLSDVQKKIVQFIEDEAKDYALKNHGVQPPPIKIFGPEAEKLAEEAEKKQKEFFEKYKISKAEHDLLVNLVFYGEFKLSFKAFGHEFSIRDIDSETKRYITDISQRVFSHKAISHLKIKAISKTLSEIDGISLNTNFLEKYLWHMQDNLIDMLYKMHLLTEKYKMHLYEKLPNFCRTPTSRVRYTICNDLHTPINDPRFRAMSEEQIYWHYINAVKNQEIENEIIQSRIDYLTWFIDPEIAKKVKDKKEMHQDADLDMAKKYSFMNGITEMIGKDMSNEEVNATMDLIMQKMKTPDQFAEKDPWAEPNIPSFDNDPFIQRLKQSEEAKSEENPVTMVGGDRSWYQG